MNSPTPDAGDDGATISIHVSKGGKTFEATLPETAILSDLISSCEDAGAWATSDTHLDWDRAKFIAKGQMLRSGTDDEKPVAHLAGKKVTLQVPTVEDIQSLQQSSEAARARQARREAQRSRAAVPWSRKQQGSDEYTFARIEPLPGLRNPERSRAFLKRLADDPGIRAAMRKHKFKVGLLTEMDPMSNTQATHEGTTRLLGLNRNRGAVIELRLRTDDYEGYRDYKTIRNTLCHELAHNVHSPHDRNFWDLCHQIEREVAAADWKHGGHSVGDAPVYEPSPEDDVPDHGGWTGGTYVLGGGGGAAVVGSRAGADAMSLRERLAQAADARAREAKERNAKEEGDGSGGGGGEGPSGGSTL